MIKEEKKIQEITLKKCFCDICAKNGIYRTIASEYRNQCYICHRDICNKHTIDDPRDNSDYPIKYCSECFDIGKKYLAEMKRIEEESDIKQEALYNEWEEKAILNALEKRQ
jgi:hypothetical protein